MREKRLEVADVLAALGAWAGVGGGMEDVKEVVPLEGFVARARRECGDRERLRFWCLVLVVVGGGKESFGLDTVGEGESIDEGDEEDEDDEVVTEGDFAGAALKVGDVARIVSLDSSDILRLLSVVDFADVDFGGGAAEESGSEALSSWEDSLSSPEGPGGDSETVDGGRGTLAALFAVSSLGFLAAGSDVSELESESEAEADADSDSASEPEEDPEEDSESLSGSEADGEDEDDVLALRLSLFATDGVILVIVGLETGVVSSSSSSASLSELVADDVVDCGDLFTFAGLEEVKTLFALLLATLLSSSLSPESSEVSSSFVCAPLTHSS